MGNQQGKTEDVDLAWLAGFLDGEGSLMVKYCAGSRMQQYRRQGQPYIAPSICVVNTDQPTLDVVRQILANNGLPHHISQRTGGVGKNGRPYQDSWDIRVVGFKRCKRWLETLIPYLRTKRGQAEALLELCNSRLSGYEKGAGYTARELAIVEELRTRPGSLHRPYACAA
jgi:hypothetical protein